MATRLLLRGMRKLRSPNQRWHKQGACNTFPAWCVATRTRFAAYRRHLQILTLHILTRHILACSQIPQRNWTRDTTLLVPWYLFLCAGTASGRVIGRSVPQRRPAVDSSRLPLANAESKAAEDQDGDTQRDAEPNHSTPFCNSACTTSHWAC